MKIDGWSRLIALAWMTGQVAWIGQCGIPSAVAGNPVLRNSRAKAGDAAHVGDATVREGAVREGAVREGTVQQVACACDDCCDGAILAYPNTENYLLSPGQALPYPSPSTSTPDYGLPLTAESMPMDVSDAALNSFSDRPAPPRSTPFGTDLVGVNTMGDFFGEAMRTVTVLETQSYGFHTLGSIVAGSPGSANSLLVFEANGGLADDFTTIGLGFDQSGDSIPDTFNMAEPLPPNEVPTSPGPGFTYAGGTVVYTGNNSTTQAIDGVYPATSPNNTWFASYGYTRSSELVVGGLAMRRIKIAEMNSPLPKHRIYGSFNFYNDVINNVGDVSRAFLGIERPFYQNLMSLDLRVPFGSTLDTTQAVSGFGSRAGEFGNIVLTAKAVLLQGRKGVVTAGLGLGLPTGSDSRIVSSQGGVELLRFENESLHVLPFVAGLWTPGSRAFVQWFLQWDIDANGSDVRVRNSGGSLVNVGTLQDQTLTFVDVTFGTWLRRDRCRTVWGIVPVAELHYSTTSQDTDSVSQGAFVVTNPTNRYDVLNLTLGSHFMIGQSTLTGGAAIPLRRSNYGDRQFDYEAVVQFERRF